jgi:hypothetical protein
MLMEALRAAQELVRVLWREVDHCEACWAAATSGKVQCILAACTLA